MEPQNETQNGPCVLMQWVVGNLCPTGPREKAAAANPECSMQKSAPRPTIFYVQHAEGCFQAATSFSLPGAWGLPPAGHLTQSCLGQADAGCSNVFECIEQAHLARDLAGILLAIWRCTAWASGEVDGCANEGALAVAAGCRKQADSLPVCACLSAWDLDLAMWSGARMLALLPAIFAAASRLRVKMARRRRCPAQACPCSSWVGMLGG